MIKKEKKQRDHNPLKQSVSGWRKRNNSLQDWKLVMDTIFFSQTNTRRLKSQEKETNKGSSEDESVTVSYKSTRTAILAGPSDQGATAILETETEKDKDAQALFEKAQKINEVLTE